ncbi:hypothetical protein GF373_10695 [bacterium]|nr:hypothetical protein [bacterium]
MKRRALLLPLLSWLVFCGFSLSPETWIKDIARLAKRSQPKHTGIQFWDHYAQTMRGFRVLFYTVPLDEKNRRVDQRLHNKMHQMLSYMCQEVLTLDAFDNPDQQYMAENVLLELVDQWKLQGEIDPNTLFNGIPSINVDLLVLMERTKYDQMWKGDEKNLLIGVNIGVFELDFGQPLIADRILTTIPWFGEQTSYDKAEQAALLKVADQVSENLHRAAEIINQARERELAAEQEAQKAVEKQKERDLRQQDMELHRFVKEVGRFLKENKEPKEFMDVIQEDLKALRQLMVKPVDKLSPAEIAQRVQLRNLISDRLQQYYQWLEDQERRRQDRILTQEDPEFQVPSREPAGQQPADMPKAATQSQSEQQAEPTRQIPTAPFSGNVFDRKWIVPQNWQPKNSQRQFNAPAKEENGDASLLNGLPKYPKAQGSGQSLVPPNQDMNRETIIPRNILEKLNSQSKKAQQNQIPPSQSKPLDAGAKPGNEVAPATRNPQLPPPVRVNNNNSQ